MSPQTEEEERVTQIRQRNLLKTAVEQTKLTFLRATTDGVKLYGSVSMTDLKEAIDKSSLGLAITEEDIRLPSGERVIKVRARGHRWLVWHRRVSLLVCMCVLVSGGFRAVGREAKGCATEGGVELGTGC